MIPHIKNNKFTYLCLSLTLYIYHNIYVYVCIIPNPHMNRPVLLGCLSLQQSLSLWATFKLLFEAVTKRLVDKWEGRYSPYGGWVTCCQNFCWSEADGLWFPFQFICCLFTEIHSGICICSSFPIRHLLSCASSWWLFPSFNCKLFPLLLNTHPH